MICAQRIDKCFTEELGKFWIKCFIHSREINDVKGNYDINNPDVLSEIYKIYREYPYIVMNGEGGFAGFFFIDYDKSSSAVGLSAYIAEGSMREKVMNLKDVISIGIIVNYFMLDFLNLKYLEFNTFSDNIVRFVKNLIPNLNSTKVRENYIMLYGKFSTLNFMKVEDLAFGFDYNFSSDHLEFYGYHHGGIRELNISNIVMA